MDKIDQQHADIEHRFTHHAPSAAKIQMHEHIRERLGNVAHDLVDWTPASREQALALTKLEEAMFWANAAIARHGHEFQQVSGT